MSAPSGTITQAVRSLRIVEGADARLHPRIGHAGQSYPRLCSRSTSVRRPNTAPCASYIRAGWQWTTNDRQRIGGSTDAVYLDRAFIQFAGFTFGKTQSFFDVPDIADMTYQTEYSRNNTGGSGTPVFAYTAMLGNGVTATSSVEDYTERRANIVDLSTAALAAAAFTPACGQRRLTTTATRCRTSSATCASTRLGVLPRSPARCIYNQALSTSAHPAGLAGQQGHPDDKWGWAVGAGILLKMPWDAKDTFAVSATLR